MRAAGDIAQRYFEALTRGDLGTAVGLIADDGDFRTPMGAMTGREAITAYLDIFEAAVPKAAYDIDTLIEDGGNVAVEGTYRATHNGPMPVPDGSTLTATGREVVTPFVTMLKVDHGKISSHRPYWDLAGFIAQLTS